MPNGRHPKKTQLEQVLRRAMRRADLVDDAALSDAVAVLDVAGEYVRDRLHAAMRMPGKALGVVRWRVRASRRPSELALSRPSLPRFAGAAGSPLSPERGGHVAGELGDGACSVA